MVFSGSGGRVCRGGFNEKTGAALCQIHSSMPHPPQDTAESSAMLLALLGKQERAKHHMVKREMRKNKCEKQPREHQGERRRGKGGAPVARADILLQPMESTIPEQIPAL